MWFCNFHHLLGAFKKTRKKKRRRRRHSLEKMTNQYVRNEKKVVVYVCVREDYLQSMMTTMTMTTRERELNVRNVRLVFSCAAAVCRRGPFMLTKCSLLFYQQQPSLTHIPIGKSIMFFFALVCLCAYLQLEKAFYVIIKLVMFFITTPAHILKVPLLFQ